MNTKQKKSGGRPVGLRKLPDGSYAMPTKDGTYIGKDGTVYTFDSTPKPKKPAGRPKGLRKQPDGSWGYDYTERYKNRRPKKFKTVPIDDEYVVIKEDIPEIGELRLRVTPIVQDDHNGLYGFTPDEVFTMFGKTSWQIVAPEAILHNKSDIYSPFFDALELANYFEFFRTISKYKSYWVVTNDDTDEPLFMFTDAMTGTYAVTINGNQTEDKVVTESGLIAFIPVNNKHITYSKKELRGRIPVEYKILGLNRGDVDTTKENRNKYNALLIRLEGLKSKSLFSLMTFTEVQSEFSMRHIEEELDEEESQDENQDEEFNDEEPEFDRDDFNKKYEQRKAERAEKSMDRDSSNSSHNTGYMPPEWEYDPNYNKSHVKGYNVSCSSHMKEIGEGCKQSKTFSLSDDVDYENDWD